MSCGLTSTQLDQYWSLGDRGFSPFQGGTKVFSFFDSLDMIRGNHDIKVGGNIRAMQMNVLAEGFQDGYWIYTGQWANEPEADLLMGLPSLAIHDQTFNGNVTGRRWKMYRPYVQDDWRGDQRSDVEPWVGVGAGDTRLPRLQTGRQILIPQRASS